MNRARGVSLIEALVALAVMAFGMLGVVAMQSTLRQSAEIAKQRSEAVRIAQESIERRRAYSVLAPVAGKTDYAAISTKAAATVAGIASNTSFTLVETVQDSPTTRTKTLVADVTWSDRTGQIQTIRLSTAVHGVPPELAGSLGLPPFGSPTRLPQGRNAAIPPGSIDLGDGTSRFTPPGGGSVTWVFDNLSGYITSICIGGTCSTFNGRLLAGYIRFDLNMTQPTEASAENPTGTASLVDVVVSQTFPVTQDIQCYEELFSTYVTYYCAIPVTSLTGNKWSGRSNLQLPNVAATIAASDFTKVKVCRYTSVRNCQPSVGDTIWGAPNATAACSGASPTPNRLMSNEEHPLDYANATSSVINQNFLVIRAGDGTPPAFGIAFICPGDEASSPLINGNTWHHQPSS